MERQQEADQQRARNGIDFRLAEERGFDDYLRTEAQDAFDKVMRRLTDDFVKSVTDGLNRARINGLD